MISSIKYVSEFKMELLQFLFSLFSSEEGLKLLSFLIGLLSGNSNEQTLDEKDQQEVDDVLNQLFDKKPPPITKIEEGYALLPISYVANKDIVYALNQYFSRA